jgi:hypothetical protein
MAATATLAPTAAASPTAATPELAYEAAQAHVAMLLGPVVAEVFAGLSPDEVLDRLPALTAELLALIERYGQMNATQAIAYYRMARVTARVVAPLPVLAPAPPPPMEQVARGLESAVQRLRVDEPTPEDLAAVVAEATAIAERHVLNTGRATIIGATLADREAKGWARGLEPGACSFCTMLALRGAVYKKHSFDASNSRFEGGGYSIKVHDHCRCHPVPVFGKYEPPADVREYAAIYKRVTKGLSGADARKAFRAALEDRDFIPPRSKPGRKSLQGKAPEGVYTPPSPERAAAMIERLEAARAKAEKTGNARLAAHAAATIAGLRARL